MAQEASPDEIIRDIAETLQDQSRGLSRAASAFLTPYAVRVLREHNGLKRIFKILQPTRPPRKQYSRLLTLSLRTYHGDTWLDLTPHEPRSPTPPSTR